VLVRGCRAGQDEAWTVLVNRYRRLVYGVAVRAGLDEDLAGEAFQRVFALLVEQLDRIEQPERIRAWLVTTASREARRMRQRQLREPPLPNLLGIGTEPTDPEPLPDAVLLELEQRQVIRDAFAKLDPRCRELLTLLFLRPGAPAYAELAADLGIPEGSIGPTRARCIEKLRKQLTTTGLWVFDDR
jgi:RNA polymerase sigma factor (sigma-70 family)